MLNTHPGVGDTAGLFPGISGLLDERLLGLIGVGLVAGLGSSNIVDDGASMMSLEVIIWDGLVTRCVREGRGARCFVIATFLIGASVSSSGSFSTM